MFLNNLVLIGSRISQKEYIKNLVDSQKIKPYNTTTFEKKIKILDIRELKKDLIAKYSKNEKRLVIFYDEITTEAQTALLKTLEELPESIYFVICAKSVDFLLPTILSRSYILNVSKDSEINPKYDALIEHFLQNLNPSDGIGASLEFAEILNLTTQEDVDLLICTLEEKLRVLIKENEQQKVKVLYVLLSKLQEYYPIMKQNNIQKRFTMEAILLFLQIAY